MHVPIANARNTPTLGLHLLYQQRVDSGEIQDDAAQREVLQRLQALADELNKQQDTPGLLGRLLGKTTPSPKGLYIWGNVGRGKSMLMDLFFGAVKVTQKRRIHFHAFMQEVHGRMHQLRQQGHDPVVVLAQQIAQETRLLCFDELQATDVADATLLYRLFDGVFAAGVVVVSTSNRPPASLYTGSVQKERFVKFIALLESQMEVLSLSSAVDYRMIQLKSLEKVYFSPLGAATDAALEAAIAHLCEDCTPTPDTFMVHGRTVPFLLYSESMGAFTFHQLCEEPLGAADYLAIARRLDTVILRGIPQLGPEKHNEAKRFVTLIDALYDHKVVLICTADAPPEALYAKGDGHFEFQRTVSRLVEMQSQRYLTASQIS